MHQQLEFIMEADKLKDILRRSQVTGSKRRENSAEHSWHLGLMVFILQEYVKTPVDLNKVLSMVIFHDLVEIDAGDTFAYDDIGNQDKAAREEAAADRIFHLLPEQQAMHYKALWEEFETGETAEAKFALALDRLQPVLLNYYNEGRSWKVHQVRNDQVVERIRVLEQISEELWSYAVHLLEDAVHKGYLLP